MMHPDSCACGTDSLELFKVPTTNVTLEDSKWMEYYPISSTLNSDAVPIEFEIKGQGDEYLDLSQSYLQVVCKFTKGDGAGLTGGGSTSTPVNNILHSLFSEIDVSLNGKVVTPGLLGKTLVVLSGYPEHSDESLYVMGKRHGRTHGRTEIRTPRANA
jgi:hypothetical protein